MSECDCLSTDGDLDRECCLSFGNVSFTGDLECLSDPDFLASAEGERDVLLLLGAVGDRDLERESDLNCLESSFLGFERDLDRLESSFLGFERDLDR